MKALTHWRPYLGWTKEPFTIMTDHANLQYWKSPKNLNHRTARWHADLQEYNFDILYIPGKTNIPLDALSRLPGTDKGENDNKEVVVLPPEKFTIATAPTQPLIEVLPLDLVKRGIMRLVHDHSSCYVLGLVWLPFFFSSPCHMTPFLSPDPYLLPDHFLGTNVLDSYSL